MSLFIAFILAAVLLGAGAMLSPAWRTAQPRVGLAATLCLALIVGGAVFYAESFGWDTLVVDYLLFALLAGVVLGGTLSSASARAEARGESLRDSDQGWPGPEDLAFFGLVALLLVIPLLQMPLPLGTQGQALALHSLAARDGASFTSLSPFAEEQSVLIAPGFHALSAYLSQALGQPVPHVQRSAAAVILLLLVWLAYDFGAELSDKRLGRCLAIAMLLCAGATRSLLDGHYSELLALLFLLAFLLYALRLLERFHLADLVAGGLLLGAVAYTSLSLSLVALMAFAVLAVGAWRTQNASVRARVSVTLCLPAIAILGIAPWLVKSLPLLLPIAPSPHPPSLGYLDDLILGQGVIALPLAIWGAILGLRAEGRLRFITLLMLGWLLLLVDFTLLGIVGSLLPPLGMLSNAPNLARHGAILPGCTFAGIALLHIWEARLPSQWRERLRRKARLCLALALLGIVALYFAFPTALDLARPLLNLPAESITRDDIAAMDWLRDNAPPHARLQAADASGWLPALAERKSVDFRAWTYFEWGSLTRAETSEPANYVFASAYAAVTEDPTLQLVFQQGDARVYQRLG